MLRLTPCLRATMRPGNDFTGRFPLIVETVANLRFRACVIDGERSIESCVNDLTQ
jgi:ATP-dependent DNA ligase